MPTLPPITTGSDTFVNGTAGNTTKNYATSLALNLKSGAMQGLLMMRPPIPLGATASPSKLRVYARGASSGSRTVTLKRVTASWAASRANWTNKPAPVAGTGTVVNIGALTDGQMIEFDVTADLQAIASGAAFYGWQIETNSTTQFAINSLETGKPPTLIVAYEVTPATPSDMRPSAGGLVGVTQPTLSWTIGRDSIASYQLQADPASNGTTPAYDSGELAGSAMHALAGTTFAQLGTDLATTNWRVRVKSTGGLWSAWTGWTAIQRDDKGSLTINSPAASPSNFVFEPTPTFTWTFTGETQQYAQIIVTPASDRSSEIYKSDRVQQSLAQLSMPSGGPLLLSGSTYSVGVIVWDAKTNRQGSSAAGDEPFVIQWRDFTVSTDAAQIAPTLSSAAQEGSNPWHLLTITIAAAPDGFVILRDGVEIAADLLPADLFSSGTTYLYRDVTAKPGTTHSYTVRAVYNGRQSVSSAAKTATLVAEGLFIIDPVTRQYFVCTGVGVNDWGHSDIVDEFQPLGSRTSITITQGQPGMAGSYEGTIVERSYKTVAAMETDLWAIKPAAVSRSMRMIADRRNIPVTLLDLSCVVSEDSFTGYPRSKAKLRFRQSGEFEYAGVV